MQEYTARAGTGEVQILLGKEASPMAAVEESQQISANAGISGSNLNTR